MKLECSYGRCLRQCDTLTMRLEWQSFCLSDMSVKLLVQCTFTLCPRLQAGTWAPDNPCMGLRISTDKAKVNTPSENGCS